MTDSNDKITAMVKDMNFQRKKPVSPQTKMMTSALYSRLAAPLAALEKLHLQLWHAKQKNDYRSLPMGEARQTLEQIEREIHAILADSFEEE